MYRRVLLSAVTSVALVSSAFAADIYMPSAPYYASVALPPSWAGFYLGVNGGYGGKAAWGSGGCVLSTRLSRTEPYSVVDGNEHYSRWLWRRPDWGIISSSAHSFSAPRPIFRARISWAAERKRYFNAAPCVNSEFLRACRNCSQIATGRTACGARERP